MYGKPIIPPGPEYDSLRRLMAKYLADPDRVPMCPPRRISAPSVDGNAKALARYVTPARTGPGRAAGGQHGNE